MNEPQRPTVTLEWLLYGLIVAGALLLRLAQLGAHPLNDVEARAALGALHQLRGLAEDNLARSPAYFFTAFFSFLLFGASDATARLGPALAGTALVLVPRFFRDQLTRGGALAASALLAVASSLVAASRSADGALLAVLGLSVAVGALWRALGLKRNGQAGGSVWHYVAAAGLGLALASGGTFWFGAVALALTVLALRWTRPDNRAWLSEAWAELRSQRVAYAVTVVLSALLVATIGLTYLRGVGGLLASWIDWLAGFSPAIPGRLPSLLLIFLIFYEPLILIFGVFGAVRAFRARHPLGQALTWFSVIALAELVIYSGRSLQDLVWVTTPLALLAGYALYGLFRDLWSRQDWGLAAAQAGISLVLAVFALLNIASFAELVKNSQVGQYDVSLLGTNLALSPVAQLVVAGLALALIAVVAYLVSLGWSRRAAALGLLAAAAGLLLSMNLGAGWGLTRLRAGSPAELWWESPASDSVNRLMQTLNSVSNYSVGNPHDVAVTVQAPANGMLAWALRDFPHAAFVDKLDPVIKSPVVITPSDQKNPTLGSSYVGQRFDLTSAWTPNLSLPQWIGWAAYRRAPNLQITQGILWVRQDVAQLKSAGAANTAP